MKHLDNLHRLTYHQAIFDFLNLKPILSPIAQATIAERETICRTTFPASVKEWFAIAGANALFEERTTPDYLVNLQELGRFEEVAQGWLHVATENQAVVLWFVPLDGSDDPPVFNDDNEYWTLNDNGEFVPNDVVHIDWQLTSATFTTFIFDSLAGLNGWYSGLRLLAHDQPPDTSMLEYLRSHYQEGPQTDLPDVTVHRFFTTYSVLSIRSRTSEDSATPSTEWILEGESPEALSAMVKRIWHYGTLAQTLTPESCSPQSREHGRLIIEQLRSAERRP